LIIYILNVVFFLQDCLGEVFVPEEKEEEKSKSEAKQSNQNQNDPKKEL
jgi:hypothetical protein